MIKIEEAIIKKLILHRIDVEGNESVLSDHLLGYSDGREGTILKKVFLKPFLSHSQTYEFDHDVNIDYNVLFGLSKEIYENKDFIKTSKDICQHLITVSKHSNIKEGDVFIVKYDNLQLNNQYYEGLGVYKFEDKENYIETSVIDGETNFEFRKGIGNRKPDKACLIVYTDEPYTLLVIDNNTETDYWQNEFIKRKPKNDFVNHTNNFLALTKNFITDQIPREFEVSKADQIDLLNRSVEYFKTNETFDRKEFEEKIYQDNGLINSFRRFDENNRLEGDSELSDNFEISSQVVKKQARVFKSVLKLDKNFHIYIHGDRKLIEQGSDENGRKYYKIYYQEEA